MNKTTHNVYEVTSPSSHITSRITKIVQSISLVVLFLSLLTESTRFFGRSVRARPNLWVRHHT